MSDEAMENHYASVHMLKEGLEEADALKIFLIGVAKAIQELDTSDDDKSHQRGFLEELDASLNQSVDVAGDLSASCGGDTKFPPYAGSTSCRDADVPPLPMPQYPQPPTKTVETAS